MSLSRNAIARYVCRHKTFHSKQQADKLGGPAPFDLDSESPKKTAHLQPANNLPTEFRIDTNASSHQHSPTSQSLTPNAQSYPHRSSAQRRGKKKKTLSFTPRALLAHYTRAAAPGSSSRTRFRARALALALALRKLRPNMQQVETSTSIGTSADTRTHHGPSSSGSGGSGGGSGGGGDGRRQEQRIVAVDLAAQR